MLGLIGRLETELVRLVGWKPKCGRSVDRSARGKWAGCRSAEGLKTEVVREVGLETKAVTVGLWSEVGRPERSG
eukprot:6247339-Amphidinium_carterae.1